MYETIKWSRVASILNSARPDDVTRPPAESTKAKYLYMCDTMVNSNNNYAMFYEQFAVVTHYFIQKEIWP
jgi:hypothetical protein